MGPPPPSVAEQTIEQLGGPGSVLVRQRADHAVLDELLDEAARTPGAAQDEVLTRLARLVFPHAYAEETVLWPVVRATLPDGEAITLRNEQEHKEINALFSDLDRTPPGPRRDELFERTAAVLRQDARDEEDLILPRLQTALSGAQLRRLGVTWELVRRTAPTRPHAVVSRRPPGNLLSGLPLSALDRSRDALDHAARSAPALAGPLRAVSGALALAAGAVEHLPPLRRGEDPSTSADRPVRR
jgi:hemerythrin superfamily protein